MFFDWASDGTLHLDVEIVESDGTKVIRRTQITRARLEEMLVASSTGMRFLLNRASHVLRRHMPLQPQHLKPLSEAPKVAQDLLRKPRTTVDDVLPQQIRDMEDRLPPPTVEGFFFPVKV